MANETTDETTKTEEKTQEVESSKVAPPGGDDSKKDEELRICADGGDKSKTEENGGEAKENGGNNDDPKKEEEGNPSNGTATEEKKQEPSASDDPPTKKKRTADHQITKDDYEAGAGGDDDEEELDRNAPFKKASQEVLAKRRIVKVKRPPASTNISSTGSGNPFGAGFSLSKSTGGREAPADPVAPATTTVTTANGSSSAKVFGSGTGFGGFGTAAAGGGGFGSSSSSGGGFGSTIKATGFGCGFGSSSAGSSGFGATASSEKSASSEEKSKTIGFGSSNFFGDAGASSSTNGSSGFTFAFANKKKDPATPDNNDGDDNDEDNDGGGTSSNLPIVKLPDRVELTTGEEDEEHIHEVRCKSYKWADAKDSKVDANGVDNESKQLNGSSATPSVKPSENFLNKVSSDDTEDGDGSKPAKKKGDWHELGVGPLKILLNSTTGKYRLVQRRESTPNGNAHKVILNLPVWREMRCMRQGDKNLTIITLGPDGQQEKYALKFKESLQAMTFENEMSIRVPMAKSCFAVSSSSD